MHRLRLLGPSLRALRRIRPPLPLQFPGFQLPRLFHSGRVPNNATTPNSSPGLGPQSRNGNSSQGKSSSWQGVNEDELDLGDSVRAARKRARNDNKADHASNGSATGSSASAKNANTRSNASNNSKSSSSSGFFSFPINPRDWTPIPTWLGLIVLAWFGYLHFRRREARRRADQLSQQEGGAEVVDVEGPWHIQLYATLPLRMLSRLWGKLTEMQIPKSLRYPIYSIYARLFDANLDELNAPLDSFPTLGDFFYRELKPGSRQPEQGWDLVSPADGKVLHFGIVASDETIEQVKGHSYSLKNLVGESHASEIVSAEHLPPLTDDADGDPGNMSLQHLIDSDEVIPLETRPSTPRSAETQQPLYFMLIYLGPGDYHRFHSPVGPFNVKTVRHIPGELYSVSPYMVEWLRNLFVLNERVAMVGSGGEKTDRFGRKTEAFDWFSMVAVGATNVGRIVVDLDEKIITNQKRPQGQSVTTFDPPASSDISDQLGGFKLGSSIVLVFRGPPHSQGHFEFRSGLEKGRKVKVGEGLGRIVWRDGTPAGGRPFGEKEKDRTWWGFWYDNTLGWIWK